MRARSSVVVGCVALLVGSGEALAEPPKIPASTPSAGAEWPMPTGDYANSRYSTLDQITPANVGSLEVAFTFSTGVDKGQESAPLMIGNTLYLVTPFPNVLYALDLTRPGAPVKWAYEPKPARAAQGVACCDVVNRGPSYLDGKVFFNTLDAFTVAVDAASGRELWKTRMGDINIGETMTMAPLVAKGKVLVGNSGGEYGVRGWIAALDVNDGKVLWKAFNTGPDAEVLIGPDFKPFYDADKGKDLGVASWPPDAWRQGGGNVWGWISYDPELNLIFHGTGNPGPWNHEVRPGDNKWTAGIFARDIDSGEARWFYQWSPHDRFDWDGINENVLIDGDWQGTPRKLLVRPERNGYLYVLDRTSGEVLSAKPYHVLTATDGVDLKTGRLHYLPEKTPALQKTVHDICPTASGAKDWNPSAYSPDTGLLYIPHVNLCIDWEAVEANYIAGTPYVGAEVRMKAGPGGHRGAFTAWDVLGERPAWSIKEDFPLWSGALATRGGVVFYGTLDGWFKALDAREGKELWRFRTDSGIIGQPTTFLGADGRQYVAILSGVGGWAGAVVSNNLDTRDRTAALGFANAVPDLKQVTTKGGTLYVFRLP